MPEASEFFGMDFGMEQAASPAPAPEVVKEAPTGALGFFGKDFGAQGTRPVTTSPVRSNRFDTVFNKLVGAESRGQHTNDSGGLTTSPVGARGITQVMPKTGDDPGFGVTPIQNTSEGEYLRFGKDYLRAMLTEFNGDYEKAVAAYNAGHASVKRAITKAEKAGGDWTEFLPKKSETIPYMRKILGK